MGASSPAAATVSLHFEAFDTGLAGLDGGAFDAVVPMIRLTGADNFVRDSELQSCTLQTTLDLTCGNPFITSMSVQFDVFGPPVGVMAGFLYTFDLGALTTLGTHDTTGLYHGRVTVSAVASDPPGLGAPEPGTWALAITGVAIAGGALRIRRRSQPAC
jgi:hypothetical protein